MFDIRNLIRMNDFASFFLFSCAFVLLSYVQVCNKSPFSVALCAVASAHFYSLISFVYVVSLGQRTNTSRA